MSRAIMSALYWNRRRWEMQRNHRCSPPELSGGLTTAPRPDWTCDLCSRVWTVGAGQTWQEIRGPSW